MNGCRYIKKRIDEAEKPDLLPFDVSEHVAQCEDCERFARDRSALRHLVAGGTRVSAPVNFDAVLKARLAEVKNRRSFWWLGSPGVMRLGAATAGMVVMLFAAQFTGLFSKVQRPQDRSQTAQAPLAPGEVPPVLGTPPTHPPEVVASESRPNSQYRDPRVKRGYVAVHSRVPGGYMSAEDGGVVLVRGRNGDADVQMPTVSVGAQPLLYVGTSQRTTRTVGTSF